jgi:hypothetical protein
MYDELTGVRVSAVRIACGQMTPLHPEALRETIEEACPIPAAPRWDRKAAVCAGIFSVLADAADNQVAGR